MAFPVPERLAGTRCSLPLPVAFTVGKRSARWIWYNALDSFDVECSYSQVPVVFKRQGDQLLQLFIDKELLPGNVGSRLPDQLPAPFVSLAAPAIGPGQALTVVYTSGPCLHSRPEQARQATATEVHDISPARLAELAGLQAVPASYEYLFDVSIVFSYHCPSA